MEEKLEIAIEEFKKYTSKFDFSNWKIELKYFHTLRVVEYAQDIAKSEKLDEHDYYLASICALLHDIARFKQAKEYNTFNDLESFDHGDMGVTILLENDYISKFVDNEEDKNIVLKSVRDHNKYKIGNDLNEKELYFTKLVRDADKIDIIDTQKNEIEDGKTEIDEEELQAIKEKRQARKGKKINDATIILRQLCFLYDLNFKRSFKIIEEKGIIERKINILKDTIDKNIVNEIESFIKDYLKNKD